MFKKNENVLIIGDLHAPFIKKGYLEFCKYIKKEYKCNKIVQIGDLVDNSASGRWDINPDGLSAGNELSETQYIIKEWYKSFPEMNVCLGNHDLRILKKTFSAGISSNWIKNYGDILNTPGWKFEMNYKLNNVLYIHGDGLSSLQSILTLALNKRISIVSGHMHTVSGITYNSSEKDLLFGMAIGCGIDFDKYCFNYARNYIRTPILSCGVVLNNGKLPIVIPFNS